MEDNLYLKAVRPPTPVHQGDKEKPPAKNESNIIFRFGDRANAPPDEKKSALEYSILQKLHNELFPVMLTDSAAAEEERRRRKNLEREDLENAILAHYEQQFSGKSVTLTLNIVRIDRTRPGAGDQYAEHIKDIASFTAGSRDDLVRDTYRYLNTLTVTGADKTTNRKNQAEIDRICDALVTVRNNEAFSYDTLNEACRQELRRIINSRPDLKTSMQAALDRMKARKTFAHVEEAFQKAEPGKLRRAQAPPASQPTAPHHAHPRGADGSHNTHARSQDRERDHSGCR